MRLDRKDLERLAERLGIAFYGLMLVAFLATVIGSPGVGFAFLVLGAIAHVLRATIEDFVARRGDDARLELEIPSLGRLKPQPPPRRAPAARPRR